jgi:hypothetical protein
MTKWCHNNEYHNLNKTFSCRQSSSWSMIIHSLLRWWISCSSGPHKHCMILMQAENFNFTDILPFVFKFCSIQPLQKKQIWKKSNPKVVPEHTTCTSGPNRHSVISFMPWLLYLKGKIPSDPLYRRLVGPQSWKIALMLVENLLTGKVLLCLHYTYPHHWWPEPRKPQELETTFWCSVHYSHSQYCVR